jgi:dTDP-4-dehydrorhamnose reductase
MKKKTVAILGATGMLGSAVYATLRDRYHLVIVVREQAKIGLLDERYGGLADHRVVLFDTHALQRDYFETFPNSRHAPTLERILAGISNVDAVINCIGITPRHAEASESLFVNGGLPHVLSGVFGSRLIHISTDAVFDGIDGAPYSEEAAPNPTDLYGLSKRMGEASDRSLILRTSIIGPEIYGSVNLLEWVKKQTGSIRGYRKAMWNGVTTFEFARICGDIIEKRESFPEAGLYHLFSTDISKYEMVTKIARKYGVDVTVTPDDIVTIDRRLSTIHSVCEQLSVPSFDDMLARLP